MSMRVCRYRMAERIPAAVVVEKGSAVYMDELRLSRAATAQADRKAAVSRPRPVNKQESK